MLIIAILRRRINYRYYFGIISLRLRTGIPHAFTNNQTLLGPCTPAPLPLQRRHWLWCCDEQLESKTFYRSWLRHGKSWKSRTMPPSGGSITKWCSPHLNPVRVADELEGKVLLCWELPGQFCHRRLVAEWLEKNLLIEVPELDVPKAT
jgi:hypothetical protein